MGMRPTIRQCVIVVMAGLAASLMETASTHSAETPAASPEAPAVSPRGSRRHRPPPFKSNRNNSC